MQPRALSSIEVPKIPFVGSTFIYKSSSLIDAIPLYLLITSGFFDNVSKAFERRSTISKFPFSFA